MPASQTQLVRLPRLQSALDHEGDRPVPFHSHAVTELVYTVSGGIRIDVNGAALAGRPGILFVLPANVLHNQWNDGAWKTRCVLYADDAPLLDDTPRTLDLSGDALAGRWIADLCQLHAAQSPLPEAVGNGFLYTLLSRLGNLEQQRRNTDELHPRLAQAVQFIHAHLTEVIDAETLASESCASYSHLSALFRDAFGCGPLKYQQNLRLASAQKLLLNPYMSLDEIAAQSGYEDTNYFVRLFRKTYGMPPGKWRKGASASAPVARGSGVRGQGSERGERLGWLSRNPLAVYEGRRQWQKAGAQAGA